MRHPAPDAAAQTLRLSCSPSLTPAAGSAQRAWLPIAVMNINELMNTNDIRESSTIFPCPCKLTFDLLTSKVESESCVTRATCMPILVFLGFSVLELFPMYATDRQTLNVRRQTKVLLNAPPVTAGITRNRADADKPRDAFRGQSRSPNMVLFDMLGMVIPISVL